MVRKVKEVRLKNGQKRRVKIISDDNVQHKIQNPNE